MADGLTNAEIAARLVLGAETVRTHVAAVLRKLGARDRTQAVVTAYGSGLLLDSGTFPDGRICANASRPRPGRLR